MLIPLTLLMLAADKPTEPSKPLPPRTVPLSEVARLKLENLSLRFQALQRDQATLIGEICGGAGIPVAKCRIDMERGAVVEVTEPVEKK
jgi:hypothetical protein